ELRRGLACGDELLQLAQDRAHVLLELRELLLEVREHRACVGIAQRGDAQRLAAALEALDELAQVVRVLADEERDLRIDRLRSQDLRGAAPQALGEEGEAVRL